MKEKDHQDFHRGNTRWRFPVLLFMSSIMGGGGTSVFAQEPAPIPAPIETAQTPKPTAPIGESKKAVAHRFWDKENDWLFAGVGVARTLDYFSTLNLRRRGRQEILITNDAVDNHAAFAVIEAAGTGVSIGASYLFHRYGHHKLERWTSIIHIGLTTGGAIRNYSLKTAHFATPAPVP
jgi:hypothetical protein